MTKVSYIFEINLPSKSGYAHHVLKICDAFSKKFETSLYVKSSRIDYKSLKNNYLLKKKSLKKISKNALKTASNYTWDKRVNKIINFFKKK